VALIAKPAIGLVVPSATGLGCAGARGSGPVDGGDLPTRSSDQTAVHGCFPAFRGPDAWESRDYVIVAEPAVLDLELASAPESVALVRAGLKGLGALLELDAELLDDLQMVASEACNNVILHAYGDRTGPLEVRITATHEGVDILVRDHGAGLDEVGPEADPDALGLAVIRSLADRTELITGADGGTEVHIEFDREIRTVDDTELDPVALGPPPAPIELPGDVVATVSQVALLSGVLGRLTRALAAQARFSIERFSDVHLIIDSLVGHVQRFAEDGRVCFALGADVRRLRLMIGPLRAHPRGARLLGDELAPLIHKLVDKLEIEPFADAEMLYLTLSEGGIAAAI
jgi:serine/threonine-protein kinase RsbW